LADSFALKAFPVLTQIPAGDLEWHVDPVQEDQIVDKMQQSEAFAKCISLNKTPLFFEFLDYKTRYRENVGVEVKGGTRTGKSTGVTALSKYTSHLSCVPFTLWHVCANEIEYLEKLKTPQLPYGSVFQIDEQTETHTGAGSYSEMQVLEDMSNIIAKNQIHTFWCMEENTVIKTLNGLIKIKDLPNPEPFRVWGFNFDKKRPELDLAVKTYSGEKEIFNIVTETGEEVKATREHRFFILNGSKIQEKKVDELRVGDKLVMI
jgi:hypothetical protein